ncbi:hypothetical protein BCR34DRAFT_488290 [Clohesyomyces aquaticus]|uniref:Gcp-like domain-containing protein n=1 Tax=Clohesyomyces aquaticus TaxID=1231657 RepID=A0A1Y1ZER0_9PLEO|nr:hypothetical protein BCR34DRAFT_488290 [Clohesyomyces aquaticus]
MRLRLGSASLRRPPLAQSACPRPTLRRSFLTLAIETSCDDTSVAIVENKTSAAQDQSTGAVLYFHKKVTSDNTAHHGVHPLRALESHQETLAQLVDEAMHHLPLVDSNVDASEKWPVVTFPPRGESDRAWTRRRPDFISVTRGPGMRSNLFCGLDTAKGLAAAWQAHALTPRLVAALENAQRTGHAAEDWTVPDKSGARGTIALEPDFPFLSVLVSGGHTLLIRSASLTDHEILASTSDIAVGECLDKVARAVLPSEALHGAKTTMYGALLERFAFCGDPGDNNQRANPTPEIELEKQHTEDKYRLDIATAEAHRTIYGTRRDYGYTVPRNQYEGQKQNVTKFGWGLQQPLSKGAGGLKSKSLEFSFSGLLTAVERLVRYHTNQDTGKPGKLERPIEGPQLEERKALARESMRAAFEHLASRVLLALQQDSLENPAPGARIKTVVVSGGVAANSFLRYILASIMSAHGYSDARIAFPPSSLCTDNAAMIAWTGIEMYSAGHASPRDIRARRKWPLDQLLSPHEEDP